MSKTKDKLPQHCSECPSRGKGIFCELKSIELDDLSTQKITNQYKKGQSIFREGNPSYGLYCVSTGNVKLTRSNPDGKEVIVKIASRGDVLGQRSIFTETNYNLSATALEDTTICFIDKKYIINLVKEQPTVAANLIIKLSKDLGASESKLSDMSQKSVKQRLVELLLLLKESHGRNLGNNEYLIDIKLTREEMASLIGTATETLIRTLSELKEEAIVRLEGKQIIIPNEQKLIELTDLPL